MLEISLFKHEYEVFCLKKNIFLKIIEKKFVRIKNITNFATKQ